MKSIKDELFLKISGVFVMVRMYISLAFAEDLFKFWNSSYNFMRGTCHISNIW